MDVYNIITVTILSLLIHTGPSLKHEFSYTHNKRFCLLLLLRVSKAPSVCASLCCDEDKCSGIGSKGDMDSD